MKIKAFISIVFLAIIYLVGVIGLSLDSARSLFISLTPITLLLSLFIILMNAGLSCRDYKLLFLPFLLGMLTESIGANTGLLFGDYSYGAALGPKIFGVPLMIGMNWVMLSFIVYSVVNEFKFLSNLTLIAKVSLASLLMVILDYFLEPFAIKYGLWTWAEVKPPLYNYICWFFISFIILYFLERMNLKSEKPISKWVYGIMIVFFILTAFI